MAGLNEKYNPTYHINTENLTRLLIWVEYDEGINGRLPIRMYIETRGLTWCSCSQINLLKKRLRFYETVEVLAKAWSMSGREVAAELDKKCHRRMKHYLQYVIDSTAKLAKSKMVSSCHSGYQKYCKSSRLYRIRTPGTSANPPFAPSMTPTSSLSPPPAAPLSPESQSDRFTQKTSPPTGISACTVFLLARLYTH